MKEPIIVDNVNDKSGLYPQQCVPSDDQRLTALHEYKKMATQENIEKWADNMSIDRIIPEELRILERKLKRLSEPQTTSDGFYTDPYEDERILGIVGAIKRRDAEYLSLLGDYFYDQNAINTNGRLYKKMSDVAYGRTKPGLRLVSTGSDPSP